MFLFKKIIASTFFGLRQLLCWVTVFPAVEKTLSDGVDVAGMFRKAIAILHNKGNRLLLDFHYKVGDVDRGASTSVK